MTRIGKYERSAELDSSQVESIEARALDDATHDAEGFVEQAGGFEQAEAIEAAIADSREDVGGTVAAEASGQAALGSAATPDLNAEVQPGIVDKSGIAHAPTGADKGITPGSTAVGHQSATADAQGPSSDAQSGFDKQDYVGLGLDKPDGQSGGKTGGTTAFLPSTLLACSVPAAV